jgi:hypothetical protein
MPDLTRFVSVPRDVRLTGGGRAVVIVAALFACAAVAAGIGLSLIHVRQQDTRGRIAHEGVRADAVITRVARTRDEHPRPVVTYRYTAGPTEYEKTTRLRERDHRPLAEDGRIAIVYLASRPASSWVAGYEPGVLPLWVIPLTALGLAFVAWLMAATLRRERALLAEGRFAEGRILTTKKVHRHNHHAYQIGYEFTTLAGTRVSAKVEKHRVPAAVGTTVTVVYHRDNPRRNALYPLSLVRLAPNS